MASAQPVRFKITLANAKGDKRDAPEAGLCFNCSVSEDANPTSEWLSSLTLQELPTKAFRSI
eukprot:4356745-Amphidinium_carterae.2